MVNRRGAFVVDCLSGIDLYEGGDPHQPVETNILVVVVRCYQRHYSATALANEVPPHVTL